MEGLILNTKEQKRLQILNTMLRGMCGAEEGAALLGLSERQVWRLLAGYREEGAEALAHGNRGRQPVNALPGMLREKIIGLAEGKYLDVNHCHLTELLAEGEGIHLSRSTLRGILLSAGICSPRHRRAPKHRCRRERYAQEGMLLQIDGSRHDWLEGRGPYLSLVGAIDDATGTIPYALFREQEDAQGYFMLLSGIIKAKGIPLAVYSDRHGIFQRSPKEPDSLEEQLEGERQPTQFGRALKELEIQPILALSPQAKGRIERLWGTLQDRLASELRLAGASSIGEANSVLWSHLLRFNDRFGVPPARPEVAYRKLPARMRLESVLCFKYQRTVAADNTISFFGRSLQLLPNHDRASYAHLKLEIQERLDGSLVVAYRGRSIATQQAPSHPVTLRARKALRWPATESGLSVAGKMVPPAVKLSGQPGPTNQRQNKACEPTPSPRKPAPDHPWRRPLLTKSLNN